MLLRLLRKHNVCCIGFQNLSDPAVEFKGLLDQFGRSPPSHFLHKLQYIQLLSQILLRHLCDHSGGVLDESVFMRWFGWMRHNFEDGAMGTSLHSKLLNVDVDIIPKANV